MTLFEPRRRSRFAKTFGLILPLIAVLGYLYLDSTPSNQAIERPGTVFDVLGEVDGSKVVQVSGHETYPTEGRFDLLTVSLVGTPESPPSLLDVWFAQLDPTQNVVPLSEIYPPGIDTKVSYAQDAQLMQDSQQEAVAAALTKLGIAYKSRNYVVSLTQGSASDGIIAPGDYILEFEGEPVLDARDLSDRINRTDGKTMVSMLIEHRGKQKLVQVLPKLVEKRLRVGIFVSPKYVFPFDVAVTLKNVGGPSGGLMFALGIYDRLTPGALNGGEHFAGTGTIDATGVVGPIGGIEQKLVAASRAGAKYFFAPAENCSETVGKTPHGLTVFKVATFDDALEAVQAVAKNQDLSSLPKCTN